MPLGYSSLRQQAMQHRDAYDAGSEANLDETFRSNPVANMLPGGYAGALNALRQQNGMQRAQANFNPQWDAWFQSMSNATRGNPIVGGKSQLGTSESRGFYGTEDAELGRLTDTTPNTLSQHRGSLDALRKLRR